MLVLVLVKYYKIIMRVPDVPTNKSTSPPPPLVVGLHRLHKWSSLYLYYYTFLTPDTSRFSVLLLLLAIHQESALGPSQKVHRRTDKSAQ